MAVKWGVIGAGGIADRRTIPEGIVNAKNSRLVAVMDIDGKKTREIAHKYKVRYYLKEEDLLKDKDIDAVYIATPVYLHHRQTLLSAREGKHVFCEKPMAMNVHEAEEMIRACQKNKIKLALGFMLRFHAHHKKIKEMIEKGKLGQVVMCRAQLTCWYPPIAGAWRQNPKLGGGGSLIDMGSVCIDLLEFLIGSKIKEVSCLTATLTHKYPVEDSATLLVRFRNGVHGVIESNFNIPDACSRNMLEIYGTKGRFIASGTIGQEPTGKTWVCLQKQGKGYEAKQKRESKIIEEEIIVQPINTYKAEIEHFSRCIERDLNPHVSGEDGLWNLKGVLSAYKSARSGRNIEL